MFNRIKELAKNKQMSVKDLALELGYSINYFYSIKNGTILPSDKLIELADYFGVSTDFLLGRIATQDFPILKEKLDLENLFQTNSFILTYKGKQLTENERKKLLAILNILLIENE